jgi:ArsR family transcriptional regulator
MLALFKALSDESRLRILRAVGSAELSVAELVGVLGVPQSTVSRHLKPLRDAGLVEARREGTSAFYHWGQVFQDRVFSDWLGVRLRGVARAAEDAASVRRVLDARRARSREFFDRIAGSYGALTEPGGGWRALASGLAVGFLGRDVADLGAADVACIAYGGGAAWGGGAGADCGGEH